MNREIPALFLIGEHLDAQGRSYITDRSLSQPIARKCGICNVGDEICFAYMQNGEIIRWKFRSMVDKKKTRFNKISDDEKENFRMPFYNQKNWPDKDFLIITEGEFDCIALMELIERNVVSLPNGAGSLESTIRNQYEYIQQFKTIYICTDMDDAGNQAAKKAMSLLPPAKYRRIILPYKDANEWLIKEKGNIQKKDLEELMLNAQKIECKSFTDILDFPEISRKQIDIGLSTGWKSLDKILGGFRKGELTVVSADTGSGKSTFCINLMYNIAKQEKGVWINSYEMHPDIVMRKVAGIVLKKKMKLKEFSKEEDFNFLEWAKKHKCYINRDNNKPDLKTLRNQFEMAKYIYETHYILIDHLDYIQSSGEKKYTYENIDETIREIHSLAMEFQLSVILVVHPKQVQDGKEISMADLKGSSGIKQYADNILILTRMDRLNSTDINRVKIRVWKNRLIGIEDQFYLRYMSETDSYVEGLND